MPVSDLSLAIDPDAFARHLLDRQKQPVGVVVGSDPDEPEIHRDPDEPEIHRDPDEPEIHRDPEGGDSSEE